MNIGLRFPAEIDIISMLSVVPSTEDFPARLQHMAWWDEQTLTSYDVTGGCVLDALLVPHVDDYLW